MMDTTFRMTSMSMRDRLLGVDTPDERNELLEHLQESDRLQWLLDQEDEWLDR